MSYLHFVECQSDGRKTKVWVVRNQQNEDLGAVHFRPTWRKYVFANSPTPVDFDAGCLREIAEFTETQTDLYKGKK